MDDSDDLKINFYDLNIGQYYIFSTHTIGKVYGKLSEKRKVNDGAVELTITDCIINNEDNLSFSVKKPVVIYSTSIGGVESIDPEAEMLIYALSQKLESINELLDADTATAIVDHLGNKPDPKYRGMISPEYEAVNKYGDAESPVEEAPEEIEYSNSDGSDANVDDYSDGSNYGGQRKSKKNSRRSRSRNARSRTNGCKKTHTRKGKGKRKA